MEAMEARISRGMEEAVDAYLEESPRQRTFRPKPRIEGRADRLRVLFEKVTKDVSLFTLRNIYDKARKLVKRDDEFRDLRALPPTQAETREFLSDKPCFQAQFAVPSWPGHNQLGSRQLEILSADLIEKENTRKVKGNLLDGELQQHILVI